MRAVFVFHMDPKDLLELRRKIDKGDLRKLGLQGSTETLSILAGNGWPARYHLEQMGLRSMLAEFFHLTIAYIGYCRTKTISLAISDIQDESNRGVLYGAQVCQAAKQSCHALSMRGCFFWSQTF